MMRPSRENTAGLILCGGAGQRMQDADKGLLKYGERSLVEWVIKAIKPSVCDIVISANRNIAAYQSFLYNVVRDETDGYQGPLAGIVSILHTLAPNLDIQAVLVTACDTPHLPDEYFPRLTAAFDTNTEITVVHDGTRRQNLNCLIHRKAWSSLIDFFELGGRAMYAWQNTADTIEVDFSNSADNFLNINDTCYCFWTGLLIFPVSNIFPITFTTGCTVCAKTPYVIAIWILGAWVCVLIVVTPRVFM